MMNEEWEFSLATIYTPNRSFKYFNDLSHVAHRFLYVVKSTIFIASVLVVVFEAVLLVFVKNKKKFNLEGKKIHRLIYEDLQIANWKCQFMKNHKHKCFSISTKLENFLHTTFKLRKKKLSKKFISTHKNLK